MRAHTVQTVSAFVLPAILILSILLPQLGSSSWASMEETLEFNLSSIRMQDIDGNNLGNSLSLGQGIVLAFDVTNDGNSTQPYVGLLQISNEGGTVFFAWRTGVASPGESISLDFTWQAEMVSPYTVTAFVWTSLDAPAALSEPSDMVISTSLDAPAALSDPSGTQTITVNVLTPLQESLQQSIEELKSEGKPYPKVTYETESKVPTQLEIEESIESEGSFVTNVTATTIIEYAGPAEAGKERWDDIIVESQEPPTTTGDNNGTEGIPHGNLTQLIIDAYPEIYGEGEGKYRYGEEPRTFTVEEVIAITFVEAENATVQILNVTTPNTRTESSNTVMGFSYVPEQIEYTYSQNVFFAEARARFLLNLAIGLRLPVQVDTTTPESIVAGSEYLMNTSITPLDFSAEDYEKMGLPAENGHEFFARFEGSLNFYARVIFFSGEKNIGVSVDIGEQCSRITGLDCQDFVTPFGTDQNGNPREFPLPTLDLSPEVTRLKYDMGFASVGLGLRIDPDFGSDKISAKWYATGDASGNGELVYSAASPSQYQIGPILAVDDIGDNDNSSDQEQSGSAVITLDNYKFHLNRQIIALLANAHLEFAGLDFQSGYVKLLEIDLSKRYGERVFGQHEGIGGISYTIPVDASVEKPNDADIEQIKNDMMSIAGVVGVSVNASHVNVLIEDIESAVLVPTQIGDRQVFREVSGPICTLMANDSNACQDARDELGNDEFVKAKLLDITGVSSVSFENEYILIIIQNDVTRKALPDRISGRMLIIEIESKPAPIERSDVAECSVLFNGNRTSPFFADTIVVISSSRGTFNVAFDYARIIDEDGNDLWAYYVNEQTDELQATFTEEETVSFLIKSNNRGGTSEADDIVTLYAEDVSDCDVVFHPESIPTNKKLQLDSSNVTSLGNDNYLHKVAIPKKDVVGNSFTKLVVFYGDDFESNVYYSLPNLEIVASLPDEGQDVGVSITNASSNKTSDAYQPSPISIKVGDTVTWTNDDSTIHTVTSGTAGTPDGKFDSSPNFDPLMAPGGTFSHTFTEVGEYPYYCAMHPNMVGTVIVAAE